ncbi:sulfuric ester hydrolase [Aureococcus anophagefferens]|nr:sulfuric ester hydrolase [Aureococcus anophagefferens]
MYRSRRAGPAADGWSHDPAKARLESVVGVLFDDLRRLVGPRRARPQELPEPARDPALVLLDGPKDLVDLARETEKRWNNGTRDALKSAEQRRLEATEAAKKDAALADGLDAALKLQPQRYGVYVQSDSRAPSEVAPAKRNESWWWASAALTARQAARHGDRYVHYRVPPTGCVAADGLTELTAPCDAAVSPAYANRSLVALGDFVAASVLWL